MIGRPLVIFDTETTGFGRSASVLEIGAVHLDETGRLTESTFHTMASPREWNDGWEIAAGIHGITQGMVDGAPSQEDALGAFIDWADGLHPNAELTAWNLSFDRRMIGQMGARAAHDLIDRWAPCAMRMCAAERGARLSRGQWRLADAAADLGIKWTGDHHRAMADAIMAAKVIQRIYLGGR